MQFLRALLRYTRGLVLYTYMHDFVRTSVCPCARLNKSSICFPRRNNPEWATTSLSRLHSHTHLRHTTLGRTPPDEWSARSRDRDLTTHNTHTHAPGGIRTRNPSKRTAADPRLGPRGERDRQDFLQTWTNLKFCQCWFRRQNVLRIVLSLGLCRDFMKCFRQMPLKLPVLKEPFSKMYRNLCSRLCWFGFFISFPRIRRV